jgi:hypothetical protein
VTNRIERQNRAEGKHASIRSTKMVSTSFIMNHSPYSNYGSASRAVGAHSVKSQFRHACQPRYRSRRKPNGQTDGDHECSPTRRHRWGDSGSRGYEAAPYHLRVADHLPTRTVIPARPTIRPARPASWGCVGGVWP